MMLTCSLLYSVRAGFVLPHGLIYSFERISDESRVVSILDVSYVLPQRSSHPLFHHLQRFPSPPSHVSGILLLPLQETLSPWLLYPGLLRPSRFSSWPPRAISLSREARRMSAATYASHAARASERGVCVLFSVSFFFAPGAFVFGAQARASLALQRRHRGFVAVPRAVAPVGSASLAGPERHQSATSSTT